jgi:hypothetical protein
MNLILPLRHILTFPFLALHGVVAEALKMGIDKAERRQEEAVKHGLEAERAPEAMMSGEVVITDEDSSPVSPAVVVAKELDRVAERPLPVQTEQLITHEKPNIPAGPRLIEIEKLTVHKKPNISTGPRLIETEQLTAPKKPNTPTGPRSVYTEQLAAHKRPDIPTGPHLVYAEQPSAQKKPDTPTGLRSVHTEQLAAQKSPNIPPGCTIVTPPHIATTPPVPRGPVAGPFPPRRTPPVGPKRFTYSNWTWTTPSPTSAATRQHHTQTDEQGRPVFHGGYLDPGFRDGGAQQYQRESQPGGYVQSERYLQSKFAPISAGQDDLDYMLDEFGRMIDLYGNVIGP